jgi:hypothetical protein
MKALGKDIKEFWRNATDEERHARCLLLWYGLLALCLVGLIYGVSHV